MSNLIITTVAKLLLAWGLTRSTQAAVIATFPLDPKLMVGYGDDPVPLCIDFDSDGKVDVFMIGNGPAIEFFVADGGRALVVRPPPPNLGGLIANFPSGFNITGLLDGIVYWYGGFPSPSVAELLGIPHNSRVLSFGGSVSDGNQIVNTGNFFNSSGYFGIEFKIEETTHFGWVHIKNETGLGHGGYIDSWAYETDTGVGILAGAVPEPSIGVLVLLAISAMVTRTRRLVAID